MRIVICSLVLVLLVALNGAAQNIGPPAGIVEKNLRAVIRNRLDAYARGDAAEWGRFVSKDCLCSSSTKAAIMKEIAARPKSLKTWFGEIADFRVRGTGKVAVVRYRVTEYNELAGQRIAAPQLRVEGYIRRNGRWVLIGGTDSVLPVDPPVARIDPKVYDSYAGQYEYAPGVVDTVTREDDRLMVQPTGQAKEELFAQDERTFFAKGQAWRMIFVRDETGRVTAVQFRLHEQDIVGRKIR
jgi:uncharacterized protein DUF3471/uncharacterized protein DUF4440